MLELRRFIAAARYEWLMQISAWRWRAASVAVLVFNVHWYFTGRRSLEFALSSYQTDKFLKGLLVAILCLTAAAGLSAMARTRLSGVHSIIMVRPFHTFTFVVGQWVGAMASIAGLLLLLAFPAGLTLVQRYEVEFYPPAFLHFIVFAIVPPVAVVLAAAMWIRACLKNSLFALLALGGLIYGIAFEANAGFTVQAQKAIFTEPELFRPVLSAFSFYAVDTAWLNAQAGRAGFDEIERWQQMALHLLGPVLFLLLACYHLRRTEPQRKVFRTYGRRWYHGKSKICLSSPQGCHHMPTFLRAFCDLRIDPHVGWWSHLAILGLVSVLVGLPVRSGLERMETRRRFAAENLLAEPDRTNRKDASEFSPSKVTDDQILPIKVSWVEGELTPAGMTLKVAFTCDAETSGRLAILAKPASSLWLYDSLHIAGREIFFHDSMCNIIEGESLKDFCDGAEHVLEMRGRGRGDALYRVSGRQALLDVPTQPVFFVQRRIRKERRAGDAVWQYDILQPRQFYPAKLAIAWPAPARLLDAPVTPENSALEHGVHKWLFDIPAKRNGPSARILISPEDAHQVLPLSEPDNNLRVIVSNLNERVARELLDETEPDIRRLMETYSLAPSRLIAVTLERPFTSDAGDFRRLRQLQLRYRLHQGRLNEQDRSSLMSEVQKWRMRILSNVFNTAFLEGSPEAIEGLLDLTGFVSGNLQPNRLNAEPGMERLIFRPVTSTVTAQEPSSLLAMSRKEMLEANKVPLFQMLYATLGHRDWLTMLRVLQEKLQGEFFSVENLQEAAEAAAGQSLTGFFDYWCRTGEGLPSYRMIDASAHWQRTREDGTPPRYEVQTRFANEGTGRFVVPVTLYCRGETVSEGVTIGPNETVSWQTTSRSMPESVTVNPGPWFLAVPVRDTQAGLWVESAQTLVRIKDLER